MRLLVEEHVVVCGAFTILEHAPFFRKICDLYYAPATIGYMCLHAFIVLYAFLTLNSVCLRITRMIECLIEPE
jgi:hypothetical protein